MTIRIRTVKNRFLFWKGLIIFIFVTCSRQGDFPVLTGPYLGQRPPGETPELFAPGILSHGFHERHLTLSPDGTEIYFTMTDDNYVCHRIVGLKMNGGVWSAPEVASFSNDCSDMLPTFSPEGERVYFNSKRPVDPHIDGGGNHDIWCIEKREDGWSQPIHLGLPVNTDGQEANPSVSRTGSLYFQSLRDEGNQWDLYVSHLERGSYLTPERLDGGINTSHNESAPCISPDETYLLFHSNRPGGYGSMDIYVSFKKDDGTWNEPINLGKTINTSQSDFGPTLSPDGKYLFFSSWRPSEPETFRGKTYSELLDVFKSPENGNGTLYWVTTQCIESLRTNHSN
jgi:Tol biopolymer transport system component